MMTERLLSDFYSFLKSFGALDVAKSVKTKVWMILKILNFKLNYPSLVGLKKFQVPSCLIKVEGNMRLSYIYHDTERFINNLWYFD